MKRNLPSTSGLAAKRHKENVETARCLESESTSDEEISNDSDASDVESDLSENERESTSNNDPCDMEEDPIAQNINDFLWENNSADYEPTLFPLLTNGEICDGILGENPTEYDCFVAIIQPDFITHITSKTNNYHTFVVNTKRIEEYSKMHKWVDTTEDEIYVFLATTMLFTHMSKNEWKDYWSTDPLIETPIFGKIMSQDRYSLLLRMLNFSDNNGPRVEDKLQKIRPIIELLRNRFKSVMKPFKHLCIDESIVPWKGRLSFKQFIPSKRHRFGVKLFVLCDVETGFILDFIIYTGSSTEINNEIADLGISGSVVTTLLEPYLDKGHTIYYDNWYSSPHLSRYLLTRKTGSCGTVRCNRKGMPKNFLNKMKKGEIEMRNTQNMMVIKWHDKRDIHMLTTVHKNEIKDTGKINFTTGESIVKPSCIVDYNLKMGAVDKADMIISFSLTARKSIKWYKKFFMHLMDLAVLNAYTLFLMRTGAKPHLAKFRLELVRQIIENHATDRKNRRGGRPSSDNNPLRLTERHFPAPVPQTEAKGSRTQRQCHVCKHTTRRAKKRTSTRFMCQDCGVGLCVHPCFAEFHTLKNF